MQDRAATILAFALTLFIFLSLNAGETLARQQIAEVGGGAGNETAAPKPSIEDRLKAMEEMIERQQREIQLLREMVEKQNSVNANLRNVEAAPSGADQLASGVAAREPAVATAHPATQSDSTQKKVDELYDKFGAIRFSGDVRFRGETFYNQGFDNPTEAPSRARLRVRARLAIDGVINENFDWGLKLATGTLTDPISTNQTLTDFFERKPISLERAFVRYDSKTKDVGVQLVAGKFEPTFRRTQMVWDDDVSVEGASEALYFKTGTSLRQLKLVAFQLPFAELPGASDGVLYGGQAQTDWQFSPSLSANFNVGYYDWVRPDLIAQALGASPNQINGGITNGAGVTGGQNGALGTTNRLIRDANGNVTGFRAGFNLFDVLGNVTWQARLRFPVTLTLDIVRNLSNRINDEQDGYWAGVQVGQTREKNDWLFAYAFTRIEQDAVLVPFNFSDILASNSRTHMPSIGYQLSSGVTIQWNGLFSQRINKIFPLSPVNRWVNRNQFDVIYKF